jgi:hypothetical protein
MVPALNNKVLCTSKYVKEIDLREHVIAKPNKQANTKHPKKTGKVLGGGEYVYCLSCGDDIANICICLDSLGGIH